MAIFSNKQKDTLPRRRQQTPAQPRASEEELGQRYAFRRNRTLTGSASSNVLSTSESNADLKSPRVQAHELARKRRHISATLGVVLLCAIGLLGLISQFTAGVVVRATPDASLQLDDTYEEAIQRYFNNRPVERLRFMVDVGQLKEYLQTAAPEIQDVTPDGSAGFGTSAFAVTVRSPIAGWSINGKQHYVDVSGTSFGRNYFAAPSVQIIDKSGVQVAAGQAVASNRFLGFVGQVVGVAKSRNYTVTQVIIPRGTTRQVELRLKGIKYPVKLSVDRSVGEQVEDMDRAVRWMASHNKSPKYVDVRVSGRAFYR